MVTERFRSYEEKNQRSDQTQRGASSSEAGRIRDFILYESQQKRERETQSQQKELFQSPPDEQESSNEKKNPRPETPKQKQETTSAQSEILLKKQEGLAEYMDDKWRGENKDNGSTDRLLNFNRLRIELERLRQKDRYLIMLSNRGPVEYQLTTDHKIERKSGVGGLSTALAGIGTYGIAVKWFSSPMSAGDRKVMEEGFPHHFVPLSEEIYTQYYNRISNNVLWFVFHEMYHQGEQNVSELAQHWKSYIQANRAFADAVHTQMKENAKQEPVVMI